MYTVKTLCTWDIETLRKCDKFLGVGLVGPTSPYQQSLSNKKPCRSALIPLSCTSRSPTSFQTSHMPHTPPLASRLLSRSLAKPTTPQQTLRATATPNLTQSMTSTPTPSLSQPRKGLCFKAMTATKASMQAMWHPIRPMARHSMLHLHHVSACICLIYRQLYCLVRCTWQARIHRAFARYIMLAWPVTCWEYFAQGLPVCFKCYSGMHLCCCMQQRVICCYANVHEHIRNSVAALIIAWLASAGMCMFCSLLCRAHQNRSGVMETSCTLSLSTESTKTVAGQ